MKGVIPMTKYREILRLHSLGFSQQNIAYSSSVSKKTVNKVIKRAKELNVSWPLDDNQTDAVLEEWSQPLLFKYYNSTFPLEKSNMNLEK
jgi:hypothetical protein